MMDEDIILPVEPVSISNKIFNVSRIMHYEKKKTRSDCFCIIYGPVRSGKTMLLLQFMRNEGIIDLFEDLIFKYKIKNLSELQAHGVNVTLTKTWWKECFRNHFGFDTEDASRKIKKGGYGFNLAFDEGIDVASWMGGMSIEKEEFNKLLLKIGEFGDMFFFITASLTLIDKNVLRRAKWLCIIAHPHEKDSNTFYLYKQWDDPIRAEKNPFDLNDVLEKIDKYKHLPTEQIYKRSKCYLGEVSYPWINPKVYDLYLKMVKRPQMLMTERKRRKYVPISRYEKLMNYASILTRNLRVMDSKTSGMIRKMAVTNDGKYLISPVKIKELDEYGENLFYKYADFEDRLNEKTMDEKKEAFNKVKQEAKEKEIELKELEKLKEEKEGVAFKAFGRRSVGDFSTDEDDIPEFDESEDKENDKEEF
jgi:hypothetical protein